jgi:hypothetical protein
VASRTVRLGFENWKAEILNRFGSYPASSQWSDFFDLGEVPLTLLLPPRLNIVSPHYFKRFPDAAFWGKSFKPSKDSIIRQLLKVGAKVVYHARRWHVDATTAFPLARYDRVIFAGAPSMSGLNRFSPLFHGRE